jgi:aldose 1-epimerase
MKLEKHFFGITADDDQADLYRLSNDAGMDLAITNYGAAVVELGIPDRDGNRADVVLGFDSLSGYLAHSEYFGAIIGRYANRIAGGRFVLNNNEYKLKKNEGDNHLHGGIKGFDKALWQVEPIRSRRHVALKLTYFSKDGEEGYPGNLLVNVICSLTNENVFSIEYTATTDQPTIVNLSHHPYFNLAGDDSGDILEHELMINADLFTQVDRSLIPTGEVKTVRGTALDFTRMTRIGKRIDTNEEQLAFGKGYDHNWMINRRGTELILAAKVYEPKCGRTMELHTTEPGLQFYSGNLIGEPVMGKAEQLYRPRCGLCLEPQHFPDSPNQPQFPSTTLKPGDQYRQTSAFKFYVS